MRVGIIGTGLLGRALSKRLVLTGHEVSVFNRTQQKAEPLKPFGISIKDSPKDLASNSEIVIIIVTNATAVEQVSFEDNGIIHGWHENLVVADMSTINPISSKKIAKKFLDHNIMMIDTPVIGGPSLAEKGQLVVLIGGNEEAYQKCKQVFDSIGERTFHLGGNGNGHAMKLVMNSQIAILALSLSEGIILAKKSSLDPMKFLEVLNSTYFKTGMSINKGPQMVKGLFEPSFYLKMMQKDLEEIVVTAKEFGANLPVTRLANEIYQNARSEGYGERDYTGILEYLEKSSKEKI